jgi:hypothetical protein
MTRPGVGRGQSDDRGGTGRTINAAPTAQTLPAQDGCGTPTKGWTGLGNVHPNRARAGGEVFHEVHGDGMCGVVVSRGTCLE